MTEFRGACRERRQELPDETHVVRQRKPRAGSVTGTGLERRQVADRVHRHPLEALQRGGPDAPQTGDGKRREEVALGPGRHGEQTVWFREIACELGQEFGGRDADRHDEPCLAAHTSA